MNLTTKKLIYPLYALVHRFSFVVAFKIFVFEIRGRVPWSFGYKEFKHREIERSIGSSMVLDDFRKGQCPKQFGLGLDERVFEYSWIFSKLSNSPSAMLDAGSTFNFKYLLNSSVIRKKELCIYTFYPEVPSFPSMNNVNYLYGDLRGMQYSDESFDEVVSQSTIEHIDMDNEMYGYDVDKNEAGVNRSFEYMIAVREMVRVLKTGGQLLLTFPYGVFKNYGFFQQFDAEMLEEITLLLAEMGELKVEFGLYSREGWQFAAQAECNKSLSYNPHTGEDKGSDGAVHCRCVCLIDFKKQ